MHNYNMHICKRWLRRGSKNGTSEDMVLLLEKARELYPDQDITAESINISDEGVVTIIMNTENVRFAELAFYHDNIYNPPEYRGIKFYHIDDWIRMGR